MPDNEWKITIDNFGGFCPAYTENSYPFYGNKNNASDMKDVDIRDPNVLTQGPGMTNLTGGDHTGELGEVLISSILKHAVTDGVTYACGEDKVFKITPSSVSNGDYPLSITGGTYQVADDLVYYKADLYVFWNDTGTNGDIAKIDLSAPSIDPDWGSTQDANLEDAPHYAINGGEDSVYFTNGRYVGKIDGTTLDVQAFDLWEDGETVSLTWNNNRVRIAFNRPNVTGSNFNNSAIYTWDGTAASWEGDPVEVSGEIGALYTKNGVDYVWWKDSTLTGGYWLGYISGLRIKPLRRYSGSLPNQAQVGEYDGFLAWLSDGELMMWGAKDTNVSVEMFPYLSAKHSGSYGAFAAPFGDVLIASSEGSDYSLAKPSGYSTSAYYKLMAYPVSRAGYKAIIDVIQVATEQMSSGAALDITLTYDQGKSTQSLTQIVYSTDNETRHKILNKSYTIEDFRLDLSWANGSTSNPVKVRGIYVKGHYIKDN